MLGLIAVITFGLLFLLTGSVVLPLKALVLNVLSLTAAFGALVWIFQDGHLGALGTTSTGTLVANIPVLLFCIAFGLSMDYEVFLLARIREYWLASGRTRADNDRSVALGLARTGRVITAAALVMSISFAALFGAHVQFMRMLGLGLTLAVLVDATLVRMVLMPAFMHVLGRWNWWAPKPLVRLHDRIGLREGENEKLTETKSAGYLPRVVPTRVLASTTLRGEAVCTTRVRRNPAWPSRSRYSASVRSRAPRFSSISRSTHLPGNSRSCLGMTNSTSNTVAWGPAAARTLRRISSAFSSGQSWMMFLRM